MEQQEQNGIVARGKARVGIVLSTLAALMIGAFAMASAGNATTTTDPVSDAFTDMNGKVTTYGAAIVALVVLAVGIFLGIKYLRKGVSKA
jgi:hypothetical protein